MENRVTNETKRRVESAIDSIVDADKNCPKAIKVFNFQGQKSPLICKKLIERLTDEKDTVLDPFFGTGSFLLGSRLAGRKCVGIELDNSTFFFVKTLLSKIDESKFDDLFQKLSQMIGEKVMSLYMTYVDEEIFYIHKLHFDPANHEFYNPRDNREIIDGRNIELEKKTSSGIKYKKFDDFDLKQLKKCESLDTSRFPHHQLIENSRINITSATGADRFDTNFNQRAKYALLLIQDAINTFPASVERDALEIALASSLPLSRIAPYGDNTNYLYHVVQYSAQERNVWTLFCDKVKSIKKYKRKYARILQSEFCNNDGLRIIEGDSLSYLENTTECFDCIYTDPPYSDQVAYLERSQLFRDWLRIFYNHKDFVLSKEMLDKEIVVTDAPSRGKKDLEHYLNDIDHMFEIFGKHIKTQGFLVFTLKLGAAKYFKILTKYIDSARKYGFEFVNKFSIDNNDPTIRKQAAFLTVTMKQVVVIFQKLPLKQQYWYIDNVNMNQQVVKMVYEAINISKEKAVDLTEVINRISNQLMQKNEIILSAEDKSKIREVISCNFTIIDHYVHLDSNELYLGLEDQSLLLLKLYNTIPVIIKKLIREKGSFCKDDLFVEIALLVFDGDSSLFECLNSDENYKSKINDLLDNYCEIQDGKYVLRKIHSISNEKAIDISTLDGTEFEELMKKLLIAQHYQNVDKVGGAGDRGVDLIATEVLPDGRKQGVIFQCKRWIGNVGSTPIQRLHSMMTIESQKIKRAVCVTTSSYTNEAKLVANMTNVELIDGKALMIMLQKEFGERYYHGALSMFEKQSDQ